MIRDISQPVDHAIAVWPGDQQYRLTWSMARERGDSVNVAAVTLSAHTGTHVDGPGHFLDGYPGVGQLSLDTFIGPAHVVDAGGRVVLEEDLLPAIRDERVERVLFRTRDSVDPGVFPERFAALSPGLARALVAAGVRLVGTDAPSVDLVDSTSLEVHHILGGGGVGILENLVLAEVPPGRYTLVALPLRWLEADSSPVRAVLLDAPV